VGEQSAVVELVVPESVICQALHCRHVDRATERTGLAEAPIIEQDAKDIGGVGGCLDL
jgi:hypothetical protein